MGYRPFGQTFDGHLDWARQSGDGVLIARIVDQGGVDQRLKPWPGHTPFWHRPEIRGQTPACIKRSAQNRDRQSAQQCFETQERRHGPNFIDLTQQCCGIGSVDNQIGNHAGTGLGLPLAKALAELHGGTLDLQSEEGKGTTATLRLPAHRMLRKPAAGAIEAVAS